MHSIPLTADALIEKHESLIEMHVRLLAAQFAVEQIATIIEILDDEEWLNEYGMSPSAKVSALLKAYKRSNNV